MRSTADALAKIVEYTTKERDDTIKTILVNSHPVFNQIATLTNIKIRILFSNISEMETFFSTFGYSAGVATENSYFYERKFKGKLYCMHIRKNIFDASGRLMPIEPSNWAEKFAKQDIHDVEPDYDDVPF